MKILFPESNWASNIGNPFFYFGISHAIRQVLPDAEIIETGSNPVLPLKLDSHNEKYSFNYAAYGGDVDAVLFTGPMFDLNFRKLFAPAFEAAKNAGQKIFLLSAGSINYDKEETAHCRAMLEEYQPDVLTTRDPQTFELYGDLAKHSYNGICGAWFAPEYYPGYDTPLLGQYLTSCFDFQPEPDPQVLLSAADTGPSTLPAMPGLSKTKGRIMRVVKRGQPERVGEYTIVRPVHRPANHPHTVFTQPNTFAAYTPHGYLNLYRNTSVTVTDRLHAAVVTMAYGNPAYLFMRSKRSFLLDAVGLQYEQGARMELDQELLANKKDGLREFLRAALPG